jgi:hypothetical protein
MKCIKYGMIEVNFSNQIEARWIKTEESNSHQENQSVDRLR